MIFCGLEPAMKQTEAPVLRHDHILRKSSKPSDTLARKFVSHDSRVSHFPTGATLPRAIRIKSHLSKISNLVSRFQPCTVHASMLSIKERDLAISDLSPRIMQFMVASRTQSAY